MLHDNLKRATTDVNWIAGWWATRNYNIGIATGEGSGVWVLDIDGDEGEATLRELEARRGAIPPTVEAITGKGRHLYWRWPTARVIRNKQVNHHMPGLDVRGNGGYVLAPPSIHSSGRVYSWSVDRSDSFEDAPEWLLDLIAKDGDREHVATSPNNWPKLRPPLTQRTAEWPRPGSPRFLSAPRVQSLTRKGGSTPGRFERPGFSTLRS
jgi:hypothetical protein